MHRIHLTVTGLLEMLKSPISSHNITYKFYRKKGYHYQKMSMDGTFKIRSLVSYFLLQSVSFTLLPMVMAP